MTEYKTLQELNHIHKGQMAFVIGAGPSLASDNLDSLRSKITFAVNSGIVAVPWASYFVSDDWEVQRWSYFQELQSPSSCTKMLLYEDKLKSSACYFGERTYLFRHRKGISIPDYYDHINPKTYIGETRTSVGSAIMIAHVMGCSPIILLGVDCCRDNAGRRYFWQNNDRFTAPTRNDRMSVDKFIQCRIKHKKTDTDLIDITRSWMKFGKVLSGKCNILNASSISTITAFRVVDWHELV